MPKVGGVSYSYDKAGREQAAKARKKKAKAKAKATKKGR
jgi:hypothetical protein